MSTTAGLVITNDQTVQSLMSYKMAQSTSITDSSTSSSSSSKDIPNNKKTISHSPTHRETKITHAEVELNRCLDEEEPLLKQYSCAWNNGSILIQGHLYITANHICFYSNILGWETKLLIKCREVISIFKQKTALIIPNAITVNTSEQEYFFASFIHRNNAFRVLQCTWRHSMKGITLTKAELLNILDTKQTLTSTTASTTDELSTVDSLDGTSDDTANSTSLSLPVDIHCTDSIGPSEETSTSQSEESNEIDSCLATHSMSSLSLNDSIGQASLEVILDEVPREPSLLIEREEDVIVRPITTHLRTPIRTRSSNKANSNISEAVNLFITLLVTMLIFSLLFLLCKISEVDPNLRPWLSWQPWCHFICDNTNR